MALPLLSRSPKTRIDFFLLSEVPSPLTIYPALPKSRIGFFPEIWLLRCFHARPAKSRIRFFEVLRFSRGGVASHFTKSQRRFLPALPKSAIRFFPSRFPKSRIRFCAALTTVPDELVARIAKSRIRFLLHSDLRFGRSPCFMLPEIAN